MEVERPTVSTLQILCQGHFRNLLFQFASCEPLMPFLFFSDNLLQDNHIIFEKKKKHVENNFEIVLKTCSISVWGALPPKDSDIWIRVHCHGLWGGGSTQFWWLKPTVALLSDKKKKKQLRYEPCSLVARIVTERKRIGSTIDHNRGKSLQSLVSSHMYLPMYKARSSWVTGK